AHETKSYLVPGISGLAVEAGQTVERGEALTEGSIAAKNFLSISGLYATESYLLTDVQKVYCMHGDEIDDIHDEGMVRQMLGTVRIIEAGVTKLLPCVLVDIHNFTDANREAFKERKRPATSKPVLLGITKASLETESFLSSAS